MRTMITRTILTMIPQVARHRHHYTNQGENPGIDDDDEFVKTHESLRHKRMYKIMVGVQLD